MLKEEAVIQQLSKTNHVLFEMAVLFKEGTAIFLYNYCKFLLIPEQDGIKIRLSIK